MSSRDIVTRSHGGRRSPWLTGLLVAVIAFLWAVLGPAPGSLVFDRTAIANGEMWRLVTGHLVHSDAQHALWNVSALAILGFLMEPRGQLRMMAAAGIGVLSVSAGLWWYAPEINRYCGLSGILNTLFVVALSDLWRAYRHPAIAGAAVVLMGKLLAETLTQQSLVITTAWPTVPLSHLAGCAGGLTVLALSSANRSFVRSNNECNSYEFSVWRILGHCSCWRRFGSAMAEKLKFDE